MASKERNSHYRALFLRLASSFSRNQESCPLCRRRLPERSPESLRRVEPGRGARPEPVGGEPRPSRTWGIGDDGRFQALAHRDRPLDAPPLRPEGEVPLAPVRAPRQIGESPRRRPRWKPASPRPYRAAAPKRGPLSTCVKRRSSWNRKADVRWSRSWKRTFRESDSRLGWKWLARRRRSRGSGRFFGWRAQKWPRRLAYGAESSVSRSI